MYNPEVSIQEACPAHLTVSELRDVYRRLAPFYGFWERFTAAKARDAAETSLFGAAEPPGNLTIVEIGCAHGSALAELATRNSAGLTIGFDISGALLRRGRGVLVCQADARAIPLPDASADRIYCAHVLDLLSIAEIHIAVAEMRRILKPSGRVALINLRSGTRWFDAAWSVLYLAFPNLLGGCRPVRVASYLSEAGFAVVKIQQIRTWGIPSEVLVAERG